MISETPCGQFFCQSCLRKIQLNSSIRFISPNCTKQWGGMLNLVESPRIPHTIPSPRRMRMRVVDDHLSPIPSPRLEDRTPVRGAQRRVPLRQLWENAQDNEDRPVLR